MLLPAAGALEKEQAQYTSDESHLDSSAAAWLSHALSRCAAGLSIWQLMGTLEKHQRFRDFE